MFLFLKQKPSENLYRESLMLLGRQINDALTDSYWNNQKKIRPDIKQVIINGMGGSNLGAEIIVSLFKKSLKLPVIIDPGYDVAGYVNKETAYIVSSYSGTTEEPIIAYNKAKKRGANIICLTAEGENKLANLAKKDKTPLLQFPTSTNPSGQPRLGLGAALVGLLLILIELGVLNKTILKDLGKITAKLSKNLKLLGDYYKSPARLMAKKIKNKQIILISGPLLAGNLKTLRNQFSESAKNLATYLTVSDMNHFALEGLKYPKNNSKNLVAIFFSSNLDDKKIQKRLKLTEDIYKKNKILTLNFWLTSGNILEQSLELLQFSSFLSYYLSIINQVDPMTIPFVDWFKKELTRS
jgi:glucose/mannose-6-phosphate isomerase